MNTVPHVLLTGLFFLLSLSGFSGADNHPVGGGPAGIANAWVSRSDIWSIHHNQAGLGFASNMQAAVYYENRFLLSELSVQNAAFVLPTKSGTFGLSYTGMGFNAYRENTAKLGYGLKLADRISAGIGLGYTHVRIGAGDYGSRGALLAELGIQFRVSKNLTLGAHAFNLSRSRLSEYNDERVPFIFRLGGHYTFSEKVLIALEVEKDISFPPTLRGGFEFHPIDLLYVRAGLSSGPMQAAFGFGLELKNFRLDLATTFHRQLGLTPQASLIYSFDKK